MRIKKVNRYYCDFCRKAGCSAGHMKKHEAHCTNNPNRQCGMCAATGEEPIPVAELIAMIPSDESCRIEDGGDSYWGMDQGKWEALWLPALQKMREATGDCPACIFAAIRQSKRIAPMPFDFTVEVREFWERANAARWERERHSLYGVY